MRESQPGYFIGGERKFSSLMRKGDSVRKSNVPTIILDDVHKDDPSVAVRVRYFCILESEPFARNRNQRKTSINRGLKGKIFGAIVKLPSLPDFMPLLQLGGLEH